MKGILVFSLSVLITSCAVPPSNKLVPKAAVRKNETRKLNNEITVNIDPRMDILFVVDDTGSMSVHQQNLARNIESFLNGFVKNPLLDYHFGVTTTDMNERIGELRSQNGNPKVIHRRLPNVLDKLRQNLVVGQSNQWQESVFAPTKRAIELAVKGGFNKGFLRENSKLVLVFVTDASDQSGLSVHDMLTFLDSNIGSKPGDYIAYGALVPPGVSDCQRDEAEPLKIIEFIKETGGSYFNLCDKDFGPHLAKIGDDIGKRTEVFIPLNKVPLVETIRVTYGTQLIPNDPLKGWSYDPDRVGLYFGKELELTEQQYGTKPKVKFTPAARPK